MKNKPLAIIAIGGNSLIQDAKHMTVLDQYHAAGNTANHIADLVVEGYDVVVTHGNGPQVGFILLRSELAKKTLHEVPLEICVADTQGSIGYQLAQTLGNALTAKGLKKDIVAMVTQVVVSEDDPSFARPSKPVGSFYTESEARGYEANCGWTLTEDAGRGWRRVVPSPAPLEIIELPTIRNLINQGVLVIAGGGGGIPVLRLASGELTGCGAVVDKDLATSLLAHELQADLFVISTAVDKVAVDFGKPQQRGIDQMTVSEAKRYLTEGQFASGSMKPKIEAALAYLEKGGKRVIITQPHLILDAVRGKNGTTIVP